MNDLDNPLMFALLSDDIFAQLVWTCNDSANCTQLYIKIYNLVDSRWQAETCDCLESEKLKLTLKNAYIERIRTLS